MPDLNKERIPPQKTPRSKAWIRLARLLPFVDVEERTFLAVSPGDTEDAAEDKLTGAVVASLAGRSRPAVFETVSDLRSADLSLLPDGARVSVMGYHSAGDGGDGLYRVDAEDTTTEDDGYLTLVTDSGVRLKAEIGSSVHVARAGVIGNPAEPENLIPGNDSTFDSYDVDPAWTGFGDVVNVNYTPGDFYTFGVWSVPSSPSSEATNRDARIFSRCAGVAEVPNSEPEMGSTLVPRLFRRGHGYAADFTATLTDGDGSGASDVTMQIAPNGFADGWVSSGRLYLKTKTSSSAAQAVAIGYRAPSGPAWDGATSFVVGGLKRPLVSGKRYWFRANAQIVSGSPVTLYAGTADTATNSVRFSLDGLQPDVSGSFIANGEVFKIGIRSGQTTSGQVFSLDDVQLFESDPSVSERPDDAGAQIQYFIDNTPGRTLLFGPRLRYYSTRGLLVGNGQKLQGQGSTLEISVGSSRRDGVHLENDGPELHDFRIVYSGSATSGYDSGGAQNIVGIGHFQYWNYPQATNVRVSGLVLEGYGAGANYSMALAIGPSRNVVVENIYVPDNANLQMAFGVYWSGELSQPVGRDFPVNVSLRNLRVGRLTATSRNGSVGLTVGGASSVEITNFFCEYVHDTFIRITTGDLGFQSPLVPEIAGLKGSGVFIQNAVCLSARRVGFRVQNLLNYPVRDSGVLLDWVSASASTSTGRITVANHGLTDGCFVEFRGASLPTGLSADRRYYVTWCDQNSFRVREITAGYGNGAFIALTSAGSGLEVKAWSGQSLEYFPVAIDRSLAICNDANPTYSGVLIDGCQNFTFTRGRVVGFRIGVEVDDNVLNRNFYVRNSHILGSARSGVWIPSGYSIEVSECVIEGNGTQASGGVDTSAGVAVFGGSDITVRNCVFGLSTGETTQGHAVFVDNGEAGLERVRLVGNYTRSSAKTTAFRLDDATSLTDSATTFLEVSGNGFAQGVGILTLFNTGSTPSKFPAASPGDGFAQMRHALTGPPFDFIATAISLGADDTTSHASRARTEGQNKTTILTGANRSAAGGPIQFLRFDSTASNSTLFVGSGFGGSSFNNCTRLEFHTAPAATGSAVARGRIDSSGNWSIGDASTDASAALTVNSTTGGFRPPRMTTAQRLALSALEGLMVYDTTLGKLFVVEATGWREVQTV